MKSHFKKIILFIFTVLLSLKFFSFPGYSTPYTLCNGREFNQRVKSFLSNNDRGVTINNTITEFKRGYNPPDDPAYYVDISEDKDGTVIAYTVENDINNKDKRETKVSDYNYTLYWYSDYIVNFNNDASFMFDKFVRLRNIDLSDFVYLHGLTDTRYMFMECRNLKNLTFKSGGASQAFSPAEMQGMFFSCQSLTNVDLTLFDTKMVDNMDELFYKCYNLKNIYVDKTRWNIENVRTFTRMFSECHCLRTNDGKKAVDIPEDEYEKYALPGDDKVEGFIKDVNYQYADYGEYIGSVPVDGANYIVTEPETTQPYAEEPEYDNETGNGNGSGIIPYVGDSASGYNAEKEQLTSKNVISPSSDLTKSSSAFESTINEAEMVPTISQTAEANSVSIEETIVETSIIEVETFASTSDKNIENEETVTLQETIESSVTESNNETGEVSETDGRRIMELDEYLKEQEGKNGDGSILGGILENYKFLLLALAISAIVILLLVGMVAYLTKSNRENKDNDSHKI